MTIINQWRIGGRRRRAPPKGPDSFVLTYKSFDQGKCMFFVFLVFHYSMKDYCIQQAKPQLDANRPKSPPPPSFLPFGEIPGSYCHT